MVRCAGACVCFPLLHMYGGLFFTTKSAEENPNVFPSDYKDEILVTLTNLLDDPTNIRSASITDPFVRLAGKEERYLVCMRFDARNLNRHYTGITTASPFSTAVTSIRWSTQRKNSAETPPTSRFPSWRNCVRPRNANRRCLIVT